jgi:MHS family shikimate/dehydroshikimate transporter-like MFS transporter
VNTKDPSTITLTIIAAIILGQIVGFGVGASWYSELFAARLPAIVQASKNVSPLRL